MAVKKLLNRKPQGDFMVVLRSTNGEPRVIKNAPILFDGRPMPTLYWLVDPQDCRRVSRLEADGGVKQSAAEVDAQALAKAHKKYELERNELLEPSHEGPSPSGGVGGTSKGVKCLHAHYAWYLVGADDPIGKWVDEKLTDQKLTGQDA